MMSHINFSAPWSRALRLRSLSFALGLMLIAAIGFVLSVHQSLIWQLMLIALPLLLLVLSIAGFIRGYRLSEEALEVRFLVNHMRYSMRDLQSVAGDESAMNRSICLFANPGLLSFRGLYWNSRLKLYRVWATDPLRAVILRFKSQTVVITPHDPQQFIIRVRTLLKTADFPR